MRTQEELLAALGAARDVIAALVKEIGYVPHQQAYLSKMTDGQMQASQAVREIDAILEQER